MKAAKHISVSIFRGRLLRCILCFLFTRVVLAKIAATMAKPKDNIIYRKEGLEVQAAKRRIYASLVPSLVTQAPRYQMSKLLK